MESWALLLFCLVWQEIYSTLSFCAGNEKKNKFGTFSFILNFDPSRESRTSAPLVKVNSTYMKHKV